MMTRGVIKIKLHVIIWHYSFWRLVLH